MASPHQPRPPAHHATRARQLTDLGLSSGFSGRRVVYLSLDLLEEQPAAALVDTIGRALELAGGREHPRLLLLDEVTSATRWRTSVKALWDDGRIDEDVAICTGSSAVDLAEGAAERLPGRRGPGRDFLVMPQSFGAFARVVEQGVPAAPGLSVGELLSADGQAELRGARIHLPALQRALERYLLFGGLPAGVAEAVVGEPAPSEEVRRVLWDSLVREVQRKGASTPAAQALLERVMRSLDSKISWSQMAREMAVPLRGRRSSRAGRTEPRTLQAYVELLAVNYFALVLYFWRQDSGTADVAKDKKMYFGDPLLHTITADRVGLQRDPHAEVENAIALALYRRYEPIERRSENMISPERLHVWGTKSGGEIDFVCGPREAIEAVEVADWARVNRQKATAPMRALPGRPAVVATRDDFELGGTANLLPAALLLWALS